MINDSLEHEVYRYEPDFAKLNRFIAFCYEPDLTSFNRFITVK